MKKYFITSDIHSYYDEFIEALNRAHFDINNKDHILIVCGDLFDRGPGTIQLYTWIKALPKKRRILIRGNHEYLFLDVIKKGYFDRYDYSNGTYNTYCDFNRNRLLPTIEKWINSDDWVNYYELNNYIFVHSFIPTSITEEKTGNWMEYAPNWRNSARQFDWIEATWGCPWKLFDSGLFNEEAKKGKILVCGHWHTSDFYNKLAGKHYGMKNNPIYLSKHIIALDACTALTHGINILTLENDIITSYNYNDKKED